jgi:hypothetical protein
VASVHGERSAWLEALIARRSRALAAYGVTWMATLIAATLYDVRLGAALMTGGVVLGRRFAAKRRYAVEGAAGETSTATVLALLPASFAVLNDVPLARGNADHVVVGPTGVWIVETKSQRGVVEESTFGVRINGRLMWRDPRRQARGEAAAIAQLLERETGVRHWVEALVCFPNATVAIRDARSARVVGSGQLLSRLRLAPATLHMVMRERFVVALRAAETDSHLERRRA